MNEEPICGFETSEAEVFRTIYRMGGVEKKSCQKIADHLNLTGIPCGSYPNFIAVDSGKRNRRIAAIWRPSHVRNMIVSSTYMGQHHFGKRSKIPKRKLIEQVVPAIVPVEF